MDLSVYIGTSVDGFIATKEGSVDWLMAQEEAAPDEDLGFERFLDSCDCMIMGRKTLDQVVSFGEWVYEGKRVIVLSNTLKTPPDLVKDKLKIYSGELDLLLDQLEDEGIKRIYVDGGKTIQAFLNMQRITDLTLTRVPLLLGDGIPLFANVDEQIRLEHISTQTFSNGFVQSMYRTKY
ncbi:MAG: dihydrofolate reductase family protein [Cellvibrionales bacterium]|nr:dihydrofolate reductase family protein [Cellvibrionales bacterium]